MDAAQRAQCVNEYFGQFALFRPADRPVPTGRQTAWRIATEPFTITQRQYEQIEALGQHLLEFYRAANRIYRWGWRGKRGFDWVADYLDRGKTERVRDYSNMNRFKRDMPLIIRPDLILTENGLIATELDAVPGGAGLLAAANQIYERLGPAVIGGAEGMIESFWRGLQATTGADEPRIAIVVSDESADYRAEMAWLADQLRERGHDVVMTPPGALTYRSQGLWLDTDGGRRRLDGVYRFFELFDLKNIPKIDLLLYAVRKGEVRITPPLKHHLEEKMLFALYQHPALRGVWRDRMSEAAVEALDELFPDTWILDARPVPPHAVIPDLTLATEPVSAWDQLKQATKSQRRFVIKPSGFSELAWGSRGLTVGHDSAAEEWAAAIDKAVAAFDDTPHILQRFHKGAKVSIQYYNFEAQEVVGMRGRVRLCPYYFVTGDQIELGGVLATVVPLNKKAIHGMTQAVMAPTAVEG